MDHHNLCNINEACFFCNMRSSCLRLRQTREKGPKGLQVKEFVCQLSQYDSKLGWNWKTNIDDVPKFIEKTLELMMKSGQDIRHHFAMPSNTQNHNGKGKDGFIFRFNVDSNQDGEQTLSIEDMINELIMEDKSKLKNKFHDLSDKCFIIHFSKPTSIRLQDGVQFNEYRIQYRSHMEKKEGYVESCYFRFDNQMYTQGEDGLIFESSFGAHQGVTMLSIYLSKNQGMLLMKNVEDFIYGKETLLRLSRQYLKVVEPEKFMEKHQKSKEYDQIRDKTPARKEMHRNIDNVRNKKPERKSQKQNNDEVRDKTPKRREMHQNIDKVRDKLP